MHRRRHSLPTVAMFTFVLSALPVKADNREQVANDLEAKHNWKVSADTRKPCAHEQSNRKMVPHMSMVRLSIEVGNPTFSTEPPSGSQ